MAASNSESPHGQTQEITSQCAQPATEAVHASADVSMQACCETGCCRPQNSLSNFLQQKGADASIGDLRGAFLVQQHEAICVGGRRLPDSASLKLRRLNVDVAESIVICPKFVDNKQGPCCPKLAWREDGEVQLGLEKYLTLWILLAVVLGVAIGQLDVVDEIFERLRVGNTNMLTAVGMIVMLLPPFASVQYDKLPQVLRTLPRRFTVGSLLLNWLVGPLLMFILGIGSLYNHSELLQGVIFIGAARCIAMVLVWTAIAGGDSMLCVSIVLVNSVATVFLYTPVVTVLGMLAGGFGVDMAHSVGFPTVLKNVAIYMGVPLAIGFGMWTVGHRHETYWNTFLPRFAPSGLLALLFSIVVMFAEMSKPMLQGSVAIADVLLVTIPLLAYFSIMFASAWIVGRSVLRATYAQTVVFAFTAASNNFELALAACTAIFGTSSKQAVATVVGPLIEIPVMLALVKLSQRLKYTVPAADAAASAQ